jgi:ABC-type sugar transport system ATPase subunit
MAATRPGLVPGPPHASREERRALLEAEGVSKSFEGNLVLDGVDLEVLPGDVHAVVGENGAGKSTLIKILGGVHPPDRGRVVVGGVERWPRSPRDALKAGIVVIHQELSLAPHLLAEENVFLGHYPLTPLGTIDRRTIRERTLSLLARLSVRVDPARPVGELSIAQQQMVEIAKALSSDARVLILDEPTAVLDEAHVATLFEVLARLKHQGLGIVYISHHLEEIFRIADHVTVLRDGRRTGFARVGDVDHAWVVDRMIGRGFPAHVDRARSTGQPALRVSGLSRRGRFEGVSFSVHEGEIVGLAGLVGAGRSEVARALIGLDRPNSGTIEVFGRPARIASPAAAARLGIAYVTEDRKGQGLFLNRPTRENLTMACLRRFYRFPFLRPVRERAFARDMVRRLDIRLPSLGTEVRNLSGGNQQKVLIGRALALEPKILILDEPTRGVDIGAKQEIYAFIERLVARGLAILLISSEMEEVLRLADRILVLREGRIAASFGRAEASESAIMTAAALAGSTIYGQ